jgi:catechol 2,3-dioxygenase-like lactoylglutathione lyase family enzyme
MPTIVARNFPGGSGAATPGSGVLSRPYHRAMPPDFPAPEEGILLTHFIVSDDVPRARDFYVDVLGGELVRDGEPTFVKLANGWIIINVGGGPTEDKPDVILETPPDPTRTGAFLNIRVADIQAVYDEWSARGAHFLTPPQDRGAEIRCYIRDPDGHLIEVGQSTP